MSESSVSRHGPVRGLHDLHQISTGRHALGTRGNVPQAQVKVPGFQPYDSPDILCDRPVPPIHSVKLLAGNRELNVTSPATAMEKACPAGRTLRVSHVASRCTIVLAHHMCIHGVSLTEPFAG